MFSIDFFPTLLVGDFDKQDNMQIEQIHALHIDECGISCLIAGSRMRMAMTSEPK